MEELISFDHRQAIQGGGNPCEGPDLVDEGVYLQYSIDAGVTWTTIHYFFPYFYTDGSDHLKDWQTYHFDIPTLARTAATAFRFTQREISSSSTDHWGLDNVAVSKYNTATTTWDNGLGIGEVQTVNPTVATTYTATITDGVTMCTSSVTVNMCVTFPVEMIGFEAKCVNGQTRIYWSTLSEINNDYFRVERSTDGIHYSSIGVVPGNGNSNYRIDYEFLDVSPPAGIVYYRLVQIDYEGVETVLEGVVGHVDCSNRNGFIEGIHFDSNSQTLELMYDFDTDQELNVSIFDLTGRLVYSSRQRIIAENTKVKLALDFQKTTSIYLIQISSNRASYVEKFYAQ